MALKSLPSGTLLNLASFSADIKPLFPSSRLCSNVSITGKSWVSTNPSLSSSQLLELEVWAGEPGDRCKAISLC